VIYVIGPLHLPLLVYLLVIGDVIRGKAIHGDYVALVRVQGEIMPNALASANNLVPTIKRACEDEDAKGVVLHINSPGGTPVQADQIYQAIMECRTKNHKKVIAVGEDALTSGAYWIAVAADAIYVNASTMTGSIGVKTDGFGVDLSRRLAEYGIERRVQTAGENKNRSDMFKPLSEADKSKTNELLTELHRNFIDVVKTNRGPRLVADPNVAFSGDYWSGRTALTMGLVDGLADMPKVLHDVYQVEQVVDYSPQPSMLDNLRRGINVSTLIDTLFRGSSEPRFVAM